MTDQLDKLDRVRELNPGRRFARNKNSNVIGVWIERGGPFHPILALAITGEWVSCNGLPLINGQPAVSEWIE